MPMLMTLRMRLPVCPTQSPERTRSLKSPMRSSTAWTSSTTSVPSTTIDSSRGARRATWSTLRFSVTLMRSPRNIASMRSRSPQASARATSRPMVSSVTRCLE